MKKLIYISFSFYLWLLSTSALAQYVRITRDAACGLYKGEILMVSDSLYNKDGKLATPKYGKIKVLGFTDKYNANSDLNNRSNFQKDSLYDISQDAADLSSVHFKGADGVDRYSVQGLKIEKVRTGYMADSSRLYYKAYLSDSMYWFVSTKDAEKYTEEMSVYKVENILDKSYREGNDVYIVCADSGRVVIDGIAKPVTIIGEKETKIADASGKEMRFLLKDGLSFVIQFECFKQKGKPATQEIVAYVLIVLLLLILCLIWKYKKRLFNWLKRIWYKENNSLEQFKAEVKLLLDQSISKVVDLIDEKMRGLSNKADIEFMKTCLTNLNNNVQQNPALLGKPLSSDEPKKDIDIEDLKMLLGENSAITKSINEIKDSIDKDVKQPLASFVGNNEKPLSIGDLKQIFDIEGLKTFINDKIQLISTSRNDEEKQNLEQERDKLLADNIKLETDIKDLQAKVSNSSDFIKNGVKVEGCDSFVGFTDNFLSTCQNAEKDIYFRLKKMSVDEKVKAEPILSEYYQARPTSMIEKWNRILATLKMCGYVSDAFVEVKNSEEREKYMQECFFKELVRPYVSALLICLERFRTGEYINLKLDDSFVRTSSDNIEEIIQVCRINEIEVIYRRLFEELNLVGEQYKSYEIIYQKPDDKCLNLLTAKGALKKNLLLSVSEYAVNSITTKRGYSRLEKTKCTVLDV